MILSFRTLVLSACTSGILGAAGCAISPADGSDEPPGQQPAAQPAAQPSEAAQSSSIVPVSSAADPDTGGAAPNDLNPCACIDLSQICDCRSGTCYGYVQSGQDGPYYCYSGTTFLYKYYCPHYNQVRGC